MTFEKLFDIITNFKFKKSKSLKVSIVIKEENIMIYYINQINYIIIYLVSHISLGKEGKI